VSLKPPRAVFRAAMKAAAVRDMVLNELYISVISEWLQKEGYMPKCNHTYGVKPSKSDPKTVFCAVCGTALVNAGSDYPSVIFPKLYLTEERRAEARKFAEVAQKK